MMASNSQVDRTGERLADRFQPADEPLNLSFPVQSRAWGSVPAPPQNLMTAPIDAVPWAIVAEPS